MIELVAIYCLVLGYVLGRAHADYIGSEEYDAG